MPHKKSKPLVRRAAILTVFDAAEFSEEGAKRVASWIVRQAKHLRRKKTRGALSKRFTARYLYAG